MQAIRAGRVDEVHLLLASAPNSLRLSAGWRERKKQLIKEAEEAKWKAAMEKKGEQDLVELDAHNHTNNTRLCSARSVRFRSAQRKRRLGHARDLDFEVERRGHSRTVP